MDKREKLKSTIFLLVSIKKEKNIKAVHAMASILKTCMTMKTECTSDSVSLAS